MIATSAPARLRLAALLLLLVAGGAFVVTGQNWVTRADLNLVRALSSDDTPLVAAIARFITQFGSLITLSLVVIAVGVGLWAFGRRLLEALLPTLSLVAAAILDPLAKLAVGRPRPPAELRQVLETSTGYPSGHSAQSAAAFLMIAFVLARGSDHPGRWHAAGMLAAGLVGLSRVVLGVHSPTDVLAGWALGAACALVIAAVALRGPVATRSAERSPVG